MATYPKTGTNLDSRTRTGLSTQILITVNGEPVGAVQQFSINQNRPLKPIQEIGTDGIIEIVPSGAATFSLTCNRIVFDGLSIPEAMSRSWVHIQAQRIPFDIIAIDKFTGSGEGADDTDSVVTTFHNCWFKSIAKSYNANDYIITENASLDCEYISSSRNGSPVAESQGVGDGRVIGTRQTDAVEQAADSGGRRGVMDFPGLIRATYG